MSGMNGMGCDPSILFDLDDLMMATDCSGDLILPPLVSTVKEEGGADADDGRFVHSPVGLPIPNRRHLAGSVSTSASSNSGGGSSSTTAASRSNFYSPAESSLAAMWGSAGFNYDAVTSLQRSSVPFPATPFNTPSQSTLTLAAAPDFKSLLLHTSASLSGGFGSSSSGKSSSVTIKEEAADVDDEDFETMTLKAMSMFPMEEDDIFQVDKADLIGFSPGPTLAQLNADDESLGAMGLDMNFDDFMSGVGAHVPPAPASAATANYSGFRKRSHPATISNSVGSDRFRMAELNAAFAASPSLSSFEMLRARTFAGDDDCMSQLGSAQMGFDLEQMQTVSMAEVTSQAPPPSQTVPVAAASAPTASLLSASLPANIGGGHSLSKLTRRMEEGGRVKPPPPYPTSPPHRNTSATVQEMHSLRSPSGAGGRLPSPSGHPSPGAGGGMTTSGSSVTNSAGGSHSPSPTGLQRPTHLNQSGARQRTVSHTAVSSPLGAGSSALGAGQLIPKSPGLAATNPLLLARLSSSAPAPSLMSSAASLASSADALSAASTSASSPAPSAWQRREPRNRLFSTSSLVEVGEVRGSTSSISTTFDSEDDSDHYEDFDDSDSDLGGSDDEAPSPSGGNGGRQPPAGMSKKERFFWQYNVQAKGPKGHKISLAPETVDPHVLNEVQDPVFSPYCSVDGIKHSGKARRGDGNDLTPNPRKLHSIGRELDKLNRCINDMPPVSELPLAVRPKSRKEKNKLASRACRLKKKAQHEANKVKLYGLEQEHRKLMSVIAQAKGIVAAKYESMAAQQPHAEASARIERLAKAMTKVKIAGHSTEFVNKVLERVKGGEPSGGLDEI